MRNRERLGACLFSLCKPTNALVHVTRVFRASLSFLLVSFLSLIVFFRLLSSIFSGYMFHVSIFHCLRVRLLTPYS